MTFIYKGLPMTWISDLKIKYPMFKDIYPYNFGVGDGWRDLIEQLCFDLSKLNIKVVQVKEKFGGLRFYVDAKSQKTSEKAYKLISAAEDKSFIICETCGAAGSLRNRRGWLSTLCDDCFKKGPKYDHDSESNNN